MEVSPRPSHSLFEVYLRLRPPPPGALQTDRILNVESPDENPRPSHITLNPPTDRRRAVEKFAFTQVFEEEATQLDVFQKTDIASLTEGVIAPQGGEGTDAVIATLGVTGSGKTHTILGTRSQRGLTQLALDVLFRSIGPNMLDSSSLSSIVESLQTCDPSESFLSTVSSYLESIYGESASQLSRINSRAATPMIGDHGNGMSPVARRNLQRASAPPQPPDVSDISMACDTSADYVVIISMYEVHNDRIYDLLTPPCKSIVTKDFRRRPLLFKSTEFSPDRKVVAGLRKVVCNTLKDAITVLEVGLSQRKVAGTGSNSVSSRSHGFFCFEVKKRSRMASGRPWIGNRLTIVDLAGSERAREAKTQGATLVEAGKINESLMYLGQCLQTQSEASNGSKPNVVPYRQCKLTELLFSNSFPSMSAAGHSQTSRRKLQKGVMIVAADPRGDFNATSQILRYSALAREVTVPRIPSITATIFSQTPSGGNQTSAGTSQTHMKPFLPPGSGSSRSHSPPMSTEERATMEIAALEIARMSEEVDLLREELEQQTDARVAAEAHLLSLEDRMLDLEATIRDECAAEFERRLVLDLARFKASLALAQERNDEHWDRKVDVLERGLEISSDDIDSNGDFDKENILVEDLTSEVERLRRENIILKRELASRSPTKRRPLTERDDFVAQTSAPSSSASGTDSVSSLERKLEMMRVSKDDGARTVSSSSIGSQSKRVRKLAAKRWEEPSDV